MHRDRNGDGFGAREMLPTHSCCCPVPSQVAVIPQHLPDAHRRLGLDLEGHLRLAPASIREVDGRLADAVFDAVRQVDHLDQEDIAIGLDAVQGHAFQRGAAPHAIARGHVAQRQPENGAGVEIAKGGEGLAPQRPLPVHGAAVHVAGAQHHVRAFEALRHVDQRGGIVGKVRIHLDDHVRPARQGDLDAFEVGGAQAQFPRAVMDAHARIGTSQSVRHLAGAVGAVIVHDQDVQIQRKRK